MKLKNLARFLLYVSIQLIFVDFNSIGQINVNYRPTNIIIFIGDGMGLASISYVMAINENRLNLEKFNVVGLSKTSSANNYVTDSGAGGTAIATGYKTYNGAIGINKDSMPLKNIMELAHEKGYATGIVVTSSITHATPASFVAHVKDRDQNDEIAKAYLNNIIDVFIGGGNKYFDKNLKDSLIKLNYHLVYDTNELKITKSSKIAAFISQNHLPRAKNRGNFLPLSVAKAIEVLSNNTGGFLLMVEGSQIDWAAHLNDKDYLIDEVRDLDRAIGIALDFALKNGKTLIIVTADHETGGIVLKEDKKNKMKPKIEFCTKNHTGVMVPVFAYGIGSEFFSGIYENTEIFNKIKSLIEND